MLKINRIRDFNDFLRLAIMFLLILSTGGIILFFESHNFVEYLIVIFSLILIGRRNINFKSKVIAPLLLWWFILIFFSFIVGTGLGSIMGVLFRTFMAFLVIVAFEYDASKMKSYFIDALVVFAYLGVVNFILANFFSSLFQWKQTESFSGAYTIGYIFNYVPAPAVPFNRNQCVFWEPGLYQMFMNILVFEILIEKKETLKAAIIPILLVVSTTSTTGLFILALLVSFNLFRGGKKKISLSNVIVVLVFASLFIPFLLENAEQKTSGELQGSSALRLYDFLMGFDVTINHPFFGIGFGKDSYVDLAKYLNIDLYSDYDFKVGERGNTNGLMAVFMKMGIPMGLYYFKLLYYQSLFSSKKIFFILMVLAMSSEPVFSLGLLFFIPFTSYITKK